MTPDSFPDGGRFAETAAAVEQALTLVRGGATVVNDVSGALADPEVLRFVADADVPRVLMHLFAAAHEVR